MPYILKYQKLEVHIDHPLENYHLPRFDWTGKITEVRYKGISLSGIERATTGPDDFCGIGFYNEFGIEQPVGYDDIQPGDWFHKIGIGLLQKEAGDYFFAHPYRIRPLAFEVESSDTIFSIRCQGPLENGYAYTYEKKIIVRDQGFDLYYQLTNTGEKPIVTDEYNHNFIRLGEPAVGLGYQLEFPFDLQPGVRGEVVNPEGICHFKEKKMQLSDSPTQPFFYSFLNGAGAVPARWKLSCPELGLSIEEVGDFISNKVNLWGWQGAISPEQFKSIRLDPGASEQWTRSYFIQA